MPPCRHELPWMSGVNRCKMNWIAYFDESGTDDASPIIYMGCAIAPADKWGEFDSEWKSILSSYSLTHVHGYDLQQSRKQFENWSLEKSLELGWKLQSLYDKYLYACGAAILRKDDYEAEYAIQVTSAPNKRSALGLTFEVLLLFTIDHVMKALGEGDVIEFVYEDGAKEIRDVRAMYSSLKIDPSLASWQKHIGSLTIRGKKECPGVQAADMYVYHSNRSERKEHCVAPSDISKSSLVDVESTPSILPSCLPYRIPITVDNLRSLRSVHNSAN